jgi:hypothetical protein
MDTAERLLRDSSPDALMRSFASLTRRLVRAERSKEGGATVRQQRDMVQAEILRRMENRDI